MKNQEKSNFNMAMTICTLNQLFFNSTRSFILVFDPNLIVDSSEASLELPNPALIYLYTSQVPRLEAPQEQEQAALLTRPGTQRSQE